METKDIVRKSQQVSAQTFDRMRSIQSYNVTYANDKSQHFLVGFDLMRNQNCWIGCDKQGNMLADAGLLNETDVHRKDHSVKY